MLTWKKYEYDLLKLAKAVVVATALVRKLSKAPSKEKGPETAKRLKSLEAAKTELIRAEASNLAGNVNTCVCWLHPSNDRHFVCCRHVGNVVPTYRRHSVMSANFSAVGVV